MLYLVGIGLKPEQITAEALNTLRKCKRAFLEDYTSSYSKGDIRDLETLCGKELEKLSREKTESSFNEILELAAKEEICVCVFGNPLNATTHIQILLDAKNAGVKTKIIAGISIFEYVSFTGLERYKFGKTTSIVFHEQDYEPESFYDTITENKKIGLHTLCLLDIKKDEDRLMTIEHAISLLERIEEKREESVISESILVGIAGAGSDEQQIKAGSCSQLRNFNFTGKPQSLIVCGKLNEKELEALKEISGLHE